MKWICRVLTCCSLLIAFSVEAQQKANEGQTTAVETKAENSVVVPALVLSIDAKEKELILLREQNKLFKEFQSLQQTTVYWALTGVFGLVMILVGASFYTNFRFYEKDKDSLKLDLDTKLDTFRSTINAQMMDQRREADQSVERNSQRVQDIMLTQLSEMRSSLDAIRLEITSEFKGVADSQAKLNSELLAVKKALSDAEVELRKVELEVWEGQDIPDNMMLALMQALKAAADSGSKGGISNLYENILNVLKIKYHDTGREMDLEVYNYVKKNMGVGAKYDPKGFSEAKKALSLVKLEAESS